MDMKGKVKVVLFEVSWMNLILRISKEIKWKVKVVLLEVSLMNFIPGITKDIKLESERCVTRSIIHELHSPDIQQDQM